MPRPHIKIDILVSEEIDPVTNTPREWVPKRAFEELLGELEALNRDVHELRANQGALLDSERNEISSIRQANLKYKEQEDALALFIREHYAREIALGQHAAFKDLVAVVTFYLGRERSRQSKHNTRTTRQLG